MRLSTWIGPPDALAGFATPCRMRFALSGAIAPNREPHCHPPSSRAERDVPLTDDFQRSVPALLLCYVAANCPLPLRTGPAQGSGTGALTRRGLWLDPILDFAIRPG
jgi:hypothetical protein